MGKVLITDTILRDAHQSQAATRMRLEEMLPVADKLDKIGYYSLECWGGATLDSCMRFLPDIPSRGGRTCCGPPLWGSSPGRPAWTRPLSLCPV